MKVIEIQKINRRLVVPKRNVPKRNETEGKVIFTTILELKYKENFVANFLKEYQLGHAYWSSAQHAYNGDPLPYEDAKLFAQRLGDVDFDALFEEKI